MAPEDGTARGLRQCSGGQRQGACQQGIEGLAELGAAQPPGAVQKTGQDLGERFEAVVRGMLDSRSNAYVEAMNGLLQQAKRAARASEPPATSLPSRICACPGLKHLPLNPAATNIAAG